MSDGGEKRALRGVPREQKMCKGHLPRVVYHQVHNVSDADTLIFFSSSGGNGSNAHPFPFIDAGIWDLITGGGEGPACGVLECGVFI